MLEEPYLTKSVMKALYDFFSNIKKKNLGSGGKIRVGRETGNKQFFFFLALSKSS